ncbi:MAG: hypothetical protein AAFU70_10240, partial [Planctomycetota bacterium]
MLFHAYSAAFGDEAGFAFFDAADQIAPSARTTGHGRRHPHRSGSGRSALRGASDLATCPETASVHRKAERNP